MADLAERLGGGYTHVTTRANLQIREIAARNAVELVEGLQDLGLTATGSGADNIRNVTGDATAGIDPQALLDTRPYAREWHHHILNERALYGLPRKFNVAFDGGGLVPTLEDTNDIGFQAVEVIEAPGWSRASGSASRSAASRATRISRATPASCVRPGEATKVADAIVRVFIREGDRTNRTKARLKYVLDAWGFEKFLAAVEAEAGAPLARVDATHVLPRPAAGPASPYRRPPAGAAGPELDRRGAAGRQDDRRADARARRAGA